MISTFRKRDGFWLLLAAAAAYSASPASTSLGLNVRVAAYNTSLSSPTPGGLASRLATTTDSQAQAIAEVVQIVRPDVLLLNEFDFDATGTALSDFQSNYLSTGQNGQAPISYPYVYVAPSNTGVQPEDELGPGFDFDFNNSGGTDQPNDAFGFGNHPGHFGMAMLSMHPIDTPNVRTFQEFIWEDMPGAVLPDNAATAAPADYYGTNAANGPEPNELESFRLSSKSHWDVPIQIAGQTVHMLASHPTPPVFDGPEDRNGRRNHDEIRLWADYITDGAGNDYIYDDNGVFGGLDNAGADRSFVILGDQNADPDEGDSFLNAIDQLLSNPRVNDVVPTHSFGSGFDSDDTAEFGLRVDYVLPSTDLTTNGSGVFWPAAGPGSSAAEFSDHRLVFVDLDVGLLGDVDLDGDLDAADIDTLYANVGSTDPRYDLDMSGGAADQLDVDELVQVILGTAYGDANLDGKVDGADFSILSGNFSQSGAGWAAGDFNGSTTVGGADFSILAGNFGFMAGPVAAAPEPTSALLCVVVLLTTLTARRRGGGA